MDFLNALSASRGFLPHGYCFLWNWELVWLHVVSDLLITLAYYSIPIALLYFVRTRPGLTFKWMFLMFGVFIFACGTTHLIGVWTLWYPVYWLQGVIKAMTAGVSVATAVMLWPLIPKALALPSPAELEATNRHLEQQIMERKSAEEEVHRLNTELERRVIARTADLEAANVELHTHIAERSRMERYQAIQFGVTSLLTESATLHEATPRLLQSICEGVGWDLGELWLVNPASKVLCWEAGWHVPSLNATQFEAISREITFPAGNSLPGRVWASGRPAWIPDVRNDDNFVRDAAASNLGLRAAFAFPIGTGSGITGVMAFFSSEIHQPDEYLLSMMAELGVKIGQFIRRAQAEEDQKRLLAILEATTDFVAMGNADGHLFHFNGAARRLLGIGEDEDISHIRIPDTHPEWANRIVMEEGIPAAIRDGAWSGETAFLSRSGREIPVSQVILAHKALDGTVEHLSTIARDITERKEAERTLRQSEERYRDLVENSEDLICTHDLEGKFLSVNRAIVRRLGYERAEDILGRTISDFLVPDTRPMFADYLEAVTKEARGHGLMKILTRGGEERIIEYQNSLRSEGVETPIVRSISHDVTERMRAEAALRKSESRYRELVENANDLIYTHDLAGQFTSLNRAGERISGYTQDEALTMNLAQVVAQEHLDRARQMMARKVEEGGPTTYELDIIAKDGHRVPLEVSTRLVFERGTPIAIQGIARDITDRKRAEATRHALYQASLEIQEPLGLRDRLDHLLQTAQTILELDRVNILLADSTGQWLEGMASTEPDAVIKTLRIPTGLDGGALAEAYRTRQMIAWDGLAPLPAHLRLQPPYDRIEAFRSQVFVNVPLVVQGRAIGVLGADRKHSRRLLDPGTLELVQLFVAQAALAIEHGRLYEAQRMAAIQLEATVEARTHELQETNAEMEAFSYSVSHDLRAPLRAMQGFAKALQEDYGDRLDAEGQDYTQRIVAGARRMDALISDLLAYSRLGREEISLQPVALTTVLAEVQAHLEALLRGAALTVVEPFPPVQGHQATLIQVVSNLLTNALKFVAPGVTPEVRVWAEPRGGRVRLWVQDNGIGIAAEHQARIFRVFERLHGSGSYPGTGIGLAIVRKGVERLRGTVGVESTLGQGSRFWVELPVAETSR